MKGKKNPFTNEKATKSKAAMKRTKNPFTKKWQTFRDAPATPTAKQVERSLREGKSLSLYEFKKGVKL
jgi:hypothetical protein